MRLKISSFPASEHLEERFKRCFKQILSTSSGLLIEMPSAPAVSQVGALEAHCAIRQPGGSRGAWGSSQGRGRVGDRSGTDVSNAGVYRSFWNMSWPSPLSSSLALLKRQHAVHVPPSSGWDRVAPRKGELVSWLSSHAEFWVAHPTLFA